MSYNGDVGNGRPSSKETRGSWPPAIFRDNIVSRYMRSRFTVRSVVALFLLLAVVAICISPTVDLPETALRSKQSALMIAMALIAIATAVMSLLAPLVTIQWFRACRDELAPVLASSQSALPLLC